MPENETLFDFFSRLALFKDFAEDELNQILRITNRVRFKAKNMICNEGDEGDSMYIIREGIVKVMRKPKHGAAIVLARLSEGFTVGEMSLVDDSPRSAALVSETDVLMYEIRRADFDILRHEFSPAAFKLLRSIGLTCCERIRDVNDQVQLYMENPTTLFTPEIKAETSPDEPAQVGAKVKRFLKIFGKRD